MGEQSVGNGMDADWIKTGKIVDTASKMLAARCDNVVKQGEKLRINMLKDIKSRQAEDKKEKVPTAWPLV
eukprot:TRINITY_DN2764_c0_g1_i1.p3 TRINITY_DN2764_c0_g1~~TRINITY_DN2764_c0_g1_i1.p3  ORF type:complete len:80 (+),score=38.53 TRINITY_DN2764_c0_g1_i1:32-241(+)